MSTSHNISILLSGLICGMILFQSAIVAPIVFKKLDGDQAKVFLRTLFPRLFKLCAFLGLISLGQLLVWSGAAILSASHIVALLTVIAMGTCNALVPATNLARDEGNQDKFDKLHKVSVYLTMFVLISNLSWIYF
ncbi:MAG: hypothetical protein CMH49_10335 [Myxococcales bacterium]|nr:hypothetical protein [Myxococcales bacterium]